MEVTIVLIEQKERKDKRKERYQYNFFHTKVISKENVSSNLSEFAMLDDVAPTLATVARGREVGTRGADKRGGAHNQPPIQELNVSQDHQSGQVNV